MNKPWLVRIHHRMRSVSFALLFIASAMHLAGKTPGLLTWGLLAALFLVYPQLQYWRSIRAPDSVKTELDNLIVDAVLLGAYMAAMGFAVWLSFSALLGILTNMATNKGWRGVPAALLATLAGAGLWVAVNGFTFSPQTNWQVMAFCLAGVSYYLVAVGHISFTRNLHLRQVRKQLQARKTELIQANQALNGHLQEIEALHQQLREHANRDALTALYNRRYLDITLERERLGCLREGRPLALLMMDVDHFKRYNDHYGHQAGDQCLIAVAKLLQTHAKRANDLAARYGGEEFLLVLPGMDVASAQVLAQEVCQGIEALAIAHAPSPIGHITLSIGLAVMTQDDPKDVGGLLRAADEALYLAKRSGRNRVQLAAQTHLPAGSVPEVTAHLMQLVWHPSYACGQANLDEHHRALFAQINALLAAVLCNRPTNEIAACIDTLIDDVTRHFAEEEQILQQAGFPAVQAHAEQHRELLDHAAYLVERFKRHDLDTGELFQFLATDLVARHMLGADRAFFSHMNPPQAQPQT